MKSKGWKLILIFSLSINYIGFSQSTFDTLPVIESAEIQWLNQYPPAEKTHFHKKPNLGNIISVIAGGNNNQSSVLNKPIAIFAENPENIWVVDNGYENLFRIKNNIAGVPRVFSRQKIIFQSLVGICSIPEQGILFTDSRMNKIFFLKNDQKKIEIFSDSLILNQPTGIAYYAPRSEIWVVETASHCITLLDKTGKKIRSFGTRGPGKGEFNFPTSIWIDHTGYVYVVDALNYRVQIFDDQGVFISSFGEGGNASGYFGMPKGIASDSYGNIYVTDALFHLIQIFDRQGHFLYSFGSQGREKGQFWMPSGIYIDKQDNIYIADSYNSRVQLFRLNNVILKNEKALN